MKFEHAPFNSEEPKYQLSTGHLDASETHGNMATRIIVPDEGGHWEIPLKGGIDVVDEVDKGFMEKSGLDLVLKESGVQGHPEVFVRYTGTDDALRTAEIDLDAAYFIDDPRQ